MGALVAHQAVEAKEALGDHSGSAGRELATLMGHQSTETDESIHGLDMSEDGVNGQGREESLAKEIGRLCRLDQECFEPGQPLAESSNTNARTLNEHGKQRLEEMVRVISGQVSLGHSH